MLVPLPVVDCHDCGGRCCTTMGYPPFLWEDEEFIALPPPLQDDIAAAVRARRGDQGLPCIWLDIDGGGRCRHYALRPDICRDFEAGGEDCLAIRQARRTP